MGLFDKIDNVSGSNIIKQVWARRREKNTRSTCLLGVALRISVGLRASSSISNKNTAVLRCQPMILTRQYFPNRLLVLEKYINPDRLCSFIMKSCAKRG